MRASAGPLTRAGSIGGLILAAAMAADGAAACAVSASSLAFGDLGLLGVHVDATAEIAVECGAGVPYAVEVDGGQAGAGSNGRRLTSGAAEIGYGLFRDVGRTLARGTGVDAHPGTGAGATQSPTLYGRVPAQGAPPTGAYSDSVIVTLTY